MDMNEGTVRGDYNDLKLIVNKLAKYWYYYIISGILALGIAFLYNTYTIPVYRVSTKVLVRDNQGRQTVNAAEMLPGFELLMGSKNFENEIQILRSSPLVRSAIDNLNFEVSYYKMEHYNYRDVYKSSPFIVIFDRLHPQMTGFPFNIEFLYNNKVRLEAEGKMIDVYNYAEEKVLYNQPYFKIDSIFNIGEDINTNHFSFKIMFIGSMPMSEIIENKYRFKFNNLDELTKDLRTLLDIKIASDRATVADLSLKVQNVNKGMDFLWSLGEEYLKQNLTKKNHIATSTIQYIDSQIAEISDSLMRVEKNLQNFRMRHQIIDIDTKVGQTYQQLQELEREAATLEVQNKYYNYINEYFQLNRDISDLIAPSSMQIDDPLLNNLIQDLIRLNNERKNLLDKNQRNNPHMRDLEIRIENQKKTISENIKYILKTSELSLADIRDRMDNLNIEIQKLPKTERDLVGIERDFRINDAIYTFLLEKRADAQIAKASNIPDSEIIEPAKMVGREPIQPKKKINYIIALFLGLIIPSGLFAVKEFVINDKINDINEIQRYTKAPVLNKIYHNPRSKDTIVFKKHNSAIAESFRSLRTNVMYFSEVENKQVILLTSTVGGEGKSFISLNLAVAFAMFNKKTIILDFDLRKPNLAQHLGEKDISGLSSFYTNNSSLEKIITKTKYPHLDYIAAGPIPPNPLEFIASDNTAKLISELRNTYEYIIVDSPPVGLVTDAFILSNYSDLVLFVSRNDYTPRRMFADVFKRVETKKMNNVEIIFNDYKIKNIGKYGYYKSYYDTKSK